MSTPVLSDYNSYFSLLHATSRIDMKLSYDANENKENYTEPEIPLFVSLDNANAGYQGSTVTDTDNVTWVLVEHYNGSEDASDPNSLGVYVWESSDTNPPTVRIIYSGTNSDASNVLSQEVVNADIATDATLGAGTIDPSLYQNKIFLDYIYDKYRNPANGKEDWPVEIVGESQSGVHVEYAMAYLKQVDGNFVSKGFALNPLNITPTLAQNIALDSALGNVEVHLTGSLSLAQFGNLTIVGNTVDLTNNLTLQPEGAEKLVIEPDITLREYTIFRLTQIKDAEGNFKYSLSQINELELIP